MIVFKIIVIIASGLFVASANAEPKRDILGFYLGMSKAEFLANSQKRGLTSCNWKADNFRWFPDKDEPRETAAWLEIICPDKTRFFSGFTRNLNTNLLIEFAFRFESKKTFAGIDTDVSQQFGITSKKVFSKIYSGEQISATFDLGEDIVLTLVSTEMLTLAGKDNRYTLFFNTQKYDREDKKAADRNAPQVKF